MPARPSRRGLVSSLPSVGRGESHSPHVYRRVGGTDLRVRPPSFLYRSWGRGESHSPHVYRRVGGTDLRVRPPPSSIGRGVGANGIRPTCTEGAMAYGRLRTPPNEARPLDSSSGLAPCSRQHVSPHGESESFLATPISFELEPVSLEVLSADSPHVYSLLGLLVK